MCRTTLGRGYGACWLSSLLACGLPGAGAAAEVVVPEIVDVHAHDATAFTEGLVFYNGALYESTGLYGESTLREVDPATGEVLRRVNLDSSYFGEGLARADERLIQLTWKEHTASVYDIASMAEVAEFTYTGEGWGLCHDGQRLVMSDGTDQLQFRDRATFALLGTVAVTLDGAPLSWLNELECVGNAVYANVWYSNFIVRIDPLTGQVTARIDCAGLLTAGEAQAADVLNGIAFDPGTKTFFVTGKLWPKVFAVRFGNLVDSDIPPVDVPVDGPVDPSDTTDHRAAARSTSCAAFAGDGWCGAILLWPVLRALRRTARRR